MDLTGLYARIAAVEGRPGRDTIDPKILMALWLYATIDGVGSPKARRSLQAAPRLPLALRRRVGQLPHVGRFSHVAGGLVGSIVDGERGLLVVGGPDSTATSGAGRDAGANQCRQVFLPSASQAGGMLRRSTTAGRGVAERIGGSRPGRGQPPGTSRPATGGSGKGRAFAAGVARDGQAGGAKKNRGRRDRRRRPACRRPIPRRG